MGVIQAERRRRAMSKASYEMESRSKVGGMAEKKKPRAVSMDETSLNRLHELHYTRNKKVSEDMRSRVAMAAPLPLPLPPPPGDPARNVYYDHDCEQQRHRRRHQRHLSIDLRASPAAKFVVQVMPWEISSSSSSSLDQLDDSTATSSSSRRSMGSHCFVPFKWEEAPGKPKRSTGSTIPAGNGGRDGEAMILDRGGGAKLRLPPRLQQHHQRSVSMPRSSPTSTLDRGTLDKENSSSSSASSPRIVDGSSSCSPGEAGSPGGDQSTPRWIRALLALHIWDTAVQAMSRSSTRKSIDREEEEEKFCDKIKKESRKTKYTLSHCSTSSCCPRKNTVLDSSLPYPSWSPAPLPRSSWLFNHRSMDNSSSNSARSSTNLAFRRLAWKSCNVVKRAVRFRWWSSSPSRPRGFHSIGRKKRKNRSIYKPLLCPVDGDSGAFGCSTDR